MDKAPPSTSTKMLGTVASGAALGGVIGVLLEGAAIGAPGGPAGAAAGAGIALAAFGAYRIYRPAHQCSCCNANLRPLLLRNSAICARCEARICKRCSRPNPIKEAAPRSEWNRTDTLCVNCSPTADAEWLKVQTVAVFPQTYNGPVPIDGDAETRELATGFSSSQELADLQLRFLCMQAGFDLIHHRKFISQEKKSGNYKFKVWKAIGTAAYRCGTT